MIKASKKLICSVILISGASFTALADSANIENKSQVKSISACEQKYSDIRELSKCLDIVKTQREDVLQTWVNNQTFILEEMVELTGRESVLRIFKRSQKDFIGYRENNCRWQYLANLPGLEAAAIYKSCFILITNDRINELSHIKND